jgi:ADP-ribose pyrophosphatase YjhB (NUDIX family)
VQIALWADKLRDLAAMGLLFATDRYDRERYQTMQDMAMAMLAFATNERLEDLEPLRAPVFSRPTPLIGGDAAVIDSKGRLLLIKRSDNEKWALPGGALEVGETPSEGALREVLEETGVFCQAVALVGVFDSRLWGLVSPHRFYLITFLCQPVEGVQPVPPSHSNETLNTGWFAEDGLPADLHPGTASRIPIAYRLWRGKGQAHFD